MAVTPQPPTRIHADVDICPKCDQATRSFIYGVCPRCFYDASEQEQADG